MILDDIKEDIKRAMKEGFTTSRDMIRGALAEIQKQAKDKRIENPDDDFCMQVIRSMVKKIQKANEEFTKAGDAGRKHIERNNLEIRHLEKYLPTMIDKKEYPGMVSTIIKDVGAKDIKEMGKVMKVIKEKHGNQVDMGHMSKTVKECLSKLSNDDSGSQ